MSDTPSGNNPQPIEPLNQAQEVLDNTINLSGYGRPNYWENAKSLLKEHSKALLGTLLSGSVFAYIASRLFVKSYLAEIGFDSLTYEALINGDTVSALTLGIVLVFLLFIIAFSVVPSTLRFLYNEIRPLFQNIHDTCKNSINNFFTLCFLTPLILLIPIHYKADTSNWIILGFSSSIMFVFIFIKCYKPLNYGQRLKFIYHAFLITLTNFLVFLPFLSLVNAINFTNTNTYLAYIILIVAWVAFAYFYGYRITSEKIFEYFFDIVFALLIVFEIAILSNNTIKIAIAEFVGIKDSKPQIYKISQKDYTEMEEDIKALWLLAQTQPNQTACQKQATKNEGKCYLLNASQPANQDIYLQAQVIFRDSDNSVLCPPNFRLDQKAVSQCFVVESKILTPTSQTVETLEGNTKFPKTYYKLDKPAD